MSADVKRSNFNPFRTPTVSPNPTGASSSSAQAQAQVQTQAPPRPHPSPSSPPRTATLQSAAIPSSSSSPRDDRRRQNSVDELAASLGASALDSEDGAPSEPPPAYSISANPIEGETTVEYGPTRPFQPAPPPPGHMLPPPQQQLFTGPQYSGRPAPYPNPHFTGPPAAGMPYMSPQHSGFPYFRPPYPSGPWQPQQDWHDQPGPSFSGPPPPRRNPSSASRPPPTPIPVPEPRSDFARDFYNARDDDDLEERNARAATPVSSDGGHGPESYEPSRPRLSSSASCSFPTSTSRSTSTSQSRYDPPNGPPPPPSLSSPFRPPQGPPPQHPARTPSISLNDFTPTTSPTPGRPLLHDGRILIYPPGYMCKKCSNTGYKQYDPSHPCRKCWEKHSKPYSATMAYAPRSDASQRPLPNFRPPQHRHSSASFLSPPPHPPPPPHHQPAGADLRRTQSAYRNPDPYAAPPTPLQEDRDQDRGPGYPGGFVQQPPHMAMPMPTLQYTSTPPPLGATRVQPGDARIGGRLCWRCDGKGSVSFMIFDSETCHVCNGLGRTFN